MKTTTYLRLSLFTPFLVWGICLPLFLLWSKVTSGESGPNGPHIISGLILWSFLFYVFGIIGWFVPYVLLALILLIWSFRSRAEMLMKVFVFAPVAMSILIFAL